MLEPQIFTDANPMSDIRRQGSALGLLQDLRLITGFARIIERPRLGLSTTNSQLSTHFFADPRPRNSLGEYAPQAEEGPDPNAMAAAYGPPAVQPVNPMTEAHVDRIKRFFGKRRGTADYADQSG